MQYGSHGIQYPHDIDLHTKRKVSVPKQDIGLTGHLQLSGYPRDWTEPSSFNLQTRINTFQSEYEKLNRGKAVDISKDLILIVY